MYMPGFTTLIAGTVGLLLAVASISACAPLIQLPDRYLKEATTYWAGVVSPLDAYTYVRTNELLCAVRFTDLRAPTGKNLPTSATYESLCFPRQASASQVSTPIRNSGSVKGEGYRCRMALEEGCIYADLITQIVVLGAEQMAIVWQRPNGLTYLSAERGQPFRYRSSVELAPTVVRHPDRIDFANTKLRWLRFDEKAPSQTIPVDQLPD